MVYTFHTPWGIDDTCNVIKYTVESMKGKVKIISRGYIKAKWSTQQYHSKQFYNLYKTTFRFYVGDGVVRVVTGSSDMQIIRMRFKLRKLHIVWNAFIESLLRLFPNVDFGIRPGDPELATVQFVGDGTEEVFVSTTRHSPSLGGAVFGGLLFGTAGAIIGGSAGTSYTSGKSFTRFSNNILAKARYSNGLLAEGVISRKSSTYQEVMVNMSRLSKNVANQ
jgi:hypothetical protein